MKDVNQKVGQRSDLTNNIPSILELVMIVASRVSTRGRNSLTIVF